MDNFTQLRTENYNYIKNKVINEVTLEKKEYQNKRFCFTSANLRNFLPSLDIDQHETIYQNILINRGMLLNETKHISMLDALISKNPNLDPHICNFDEHKKNAKIFCTYHLGAYRTIIGLLAKSGLDFILPIDTNTYNNQKDDILALVKSIQENYQTQGYFQIVDAEKPDVGILLAESLRENINLIIYIDGNSGTGGVFNKKADVQNVQFLNKNILVRKGIAHLSYLTKKSIIPFISHYESHLAIYPIIELFNAAIPDQKVDLQTYITNTNNYLWGILEDKLKKYTEQWEGWFYIHKYLELNDKANIFDKTNDQITINNDKKLCLDILRYDIFKISADNYILNKENYRSEEHTSELQS